MQKKRVENKNETDIPKETNFSHFAGMFIIRFCSLRLFNILFVQHTEFRSFFGTFSMLLFFV